MVPQVADPLAPLLRAIAQFAKRSRGRGRPPRIASASLSTQLQDLVTPLDATVTSGAHPSELLENPAFTTATGTSCGLSCAAREVIAGRSDAVGARAAARGCVRGR